ncbi:MAG TPA: SRPBCC domain-containing protein [Pyrinomonadaceae bacterium]|nr:SRPBCC domain-containing protein [Pyrinomonadaceae bacterium]
MFRVRAEFREDLELGASVGRVRALFADPQSFARLMPGVESVEQGGADTAAWTVRADIPLVGAARGKFELERRDESESRVEWGPAATEEKNLLRYAIAFDDLGPTRTLARVALRVELRRAHARELHLAAALLGEGRLSAGVESRVRQMMKTFLARARAELEGKSGGE